MSGACISLADLLTASSSMLASSEAALQEERKRTASDIATAFRDRAGLVDGYWKQAHVARLRYEAANGMHDVLTIAVAEDKKL